MKKRVFIFFFLILTIFLFGYLVVSKTSFSKNLTVEYSCKRSGGRWTKGGLASTYSCIHSYPDGGKQCKTSNDCFGECVVTNYKNPDPHCDFDDGPYGCKASIEEFNKTGSLVCID